MFARNIDFVPGGFVLTRREHYVREMAGEPIQGGGPDTEWAEYGIRLWKAGQRSSDDPDVAVRRLGDGRSKPDVSGGEEQRERLAKHMDWLASRPPRSAMYGLAARSHGKAKTRLLMIDDRVPHPYLVEGHPRTNLILSELIGKGYAITYYAMFVQEDWAVKIIGILHDESRSSLNTALPSSPNSSRRGVASTTWFSSAGHTIWRSRNGTCSATPLPPAQELFMTRRRSTRFGRSSNCDSGNSRLG